MPNNPNAIDNLTSRKKGDPPLPGAGRPKGSRSMKTILRDMLEQDPEDLFIIAEDDDRMKKVLLNKKIKTIKELINWRLSLMAALGHIEAIKTIYKETGESEADNVNVNVSGDIDKTISSISPEKLIELRNIISSLENE